MTSSLLPFLKFLALVLLGGSAALTAATLVLDLGAPQARAHSQAQIVVAATADALSLLI